jgi:hypothetical protein
MDIPKIDKNFVVTQKFLRDNLDICFIFGDNKAGFGLGGAAALRYEPNTYGFVTKIFPDNRDVSFYRPAEYLPVYLKEIEKLKNFIARGEYKCYLISKLGGGLANKYGIWEKIIEPNIRKDLEEFNNVIYLF